METAVFGAGCFWGVEALFRQTDGVSEAFSGYCGGRTENPSYQEVCTGTTDHAEVVQVHFDPDTVTYEELVRIFFNGHNPTTMNRQGPDIGTQYRSAIYYNSDEQKIAAEKIKEELNQDGAFQDPIVTEIAEAKPFYMAEDYHQKYLEKRGMDNCHF
jgi:peptide-methionine (S)-S-oxide reductase